MLFLSFGAHSASRRQQKLCHDGVPCPNWPRAAALISTPLSISKAREPQDLITRHAVETRRVEAPGQEPRAVRHWPAERNESFSLHIRLHPVPRTSRRGLLFFFLFVFCVKLEPSSFLLLFAPFSCPCSGSLLQCRSYRVALFSLLCIRRSTSDSRSSPTMKHEL